MNNPDLTPALSGIIAGDMTEHIREFLKFAVQNETHGHGTYYFGIVASACYLESILEEFTVLWCKKQKAEDLEFYARLMETVAKDISRATGLDTWKKWMRTLYDIDLASVLGEDWQTLSIHFKLRNQLAHGRTTKFIHFWNSTGKFLGMSLEGSSYEEPFQYLIQKNVITVTPGNTPSSELLLTCSVCRYFFEAVERAIKTLKSFPALANLRS